MKSYDECMKRLLLASGALALWGLAPGLAAQPVCGESDCPPGYECRSELGRCDAPCWVSETGETECVPCDPEPYVYCVRAACNTDADCGADMRCHSYTETRCSGAGPACPPGSTECPAPEPEECTVTGYSQCAYPHELPCDVDLDCGAGYRCVESLQCGCSGSPGVPPAGATPVTAPEPSTAGGPAAPPPHLEAPPGESDCGCSPTGTNHCEVVETPCATDADCLAGWSCVPWRGTCWADSAGNSGCDEVVHECRPSYGPVGPGDPGAGTEAPAPDVPTAPGLGDDPDHGADEGAPQRPRKRIPWHLWGCSAAATGAGGMASGNAGWALGLLGLGWVASRRRQQGAPSEKS